ncbi:MAG: MarR family transcriptional regulator [Nocardioidaceae bacterium]|nr:MarR family transcriptional regulator [Nocardioidaceae bacterium]
MIHDLDPVIHAPKRLAAMAVLVSATSADFGFLRDHLEVSDSDLSKQMAALEKAGYVSISKTSRGRGGSTTYKLTGAGRRAYESHRAALRAILDAD